MSKIQLEMQEDYWFLRDNGVRSLSAIYMVGLAYNVKPGIIGLPRKETRNGFRRKTKR